MSFGLVAHMIRTSKLRNSTRKDGHSMGWKETAIREPIVLWPAGSFSGTVFDSAGNPVSGAKVRLLYAFKKTDDIGGHILKGSDVLDYLTVTTDAKSRFCFDMLADGANIQLSISKEGYATYHTQELSEEIYPYNLEGPTYHETGLSRKKLPPRYKVGMKNARFVLKPEAIVQGIVKDDKSGKVCADIPLYLYRDGEVSLPRYIPKIQSTTDKHGRFDFRGLEAGHYLLSYVEHGQPYAPNGIPIELSEGQTLDDLTFELSRGGTLDLRLLDADTNMPLDNCKVAVEKARELNRSDSSRFLSDIGLFRPDTSYFRTNQQGRIIQHLVPGFYTIKSLDKLGYGYLRPEHFFQIENDKTSSLSFELKQFPRIEIAVRGPNGNPVKDADASVYVYNQKDEVKFVMTDSSRTDANGILTAWKDLKWIESPIQEDDRLVIKAWCWMKNLVRIKPISISDKNVTITLQHGIKVVGSIQDEQQNPLPHICVNNTCWTDRHGRFTITAISPQTKSLMLWFFPEGYGYVRKKLNLDEAQNRIIKVPKITLKRVMHLIPCKVVDQDGKPVEGASITTVSEKDTTVFGKSDAEGNFSFQISEWPVMVFAKKKLENGQILSGGTQVTVAGQLGVIVLKLEKKMENSN
jgi:protocatechuate 3,4-dioxygenase beta subunit